MSKIDQQEKRPTMSGDLRSSTSSTPRPISAQSVVIALLVLVGTISIILIALQVLFARRIPELTEAALTAAEAKWESNGPTSYDMEIEIEGARPGKLRIEVREGHVVALTRDGRSPPERTWHYWSVPGRFNELERELELADDPVHEMRAEASTRLQPRCEFDPELGFPRVFHRIVFGGGPEVYWRVTKFEAR